MLDPLQRLFSALWENDVSQFFSILIIGYFVIALALINTQHTRIRRLTENAPSAMTSLGILGTFMGIFLGLLDFDIRTINRSVPFLLEGLKVAFGTSILGLAAAIIFRPTSQLMRQTAVTQSASIEDIVEGLQNLQSTNVEIKDISSQGFDTLYNALTDDKDSSIVGQIQRMRTNLSDLENTTRHGFEEQVSEFKAFAATMSEAFSKAIIEELKDVIREFNEKISEQFGENFKQLNQAVGQLTAWQEQYRQQMDAMKSDLESTMTSIQANNASLKEIASSVSGIPTYMENLRSIMETLDRQNRTLEEGLSAFADIKEKAVNAFPEIEKNIERITENMRTTVEHEAQTIQSMSENLREIMDNQKQGSKQLIEAMTDSMNDQKTAQDQLMEGLQKSFNETIANATNSMSQSIEQLDKAIEDEIKKAATTMAENLSGITEKFVSDYQPLLETTRKIVELAERGKRQDA